MTMDFLSTMRDNRPERDWIVGDHVFAYGFDQTYEWVGVKKRGQRQSLETVDAGGMPMSVRHEVYINSIHIHLPASLGTLSPADIAKIRANHGSPYTEDYNLLYDFIRVSKCCIEPVTSVDSFDSDCACVCCLQPSAVERYLREFMADALLSVSSVTVMINVEPSQLGLSTLATALFGRRAVNTGGPSEFDILEPLMNTNTMSHVDAMKIFPPPLFSFRSKTCGECGYWRRPVGDSSQE